MDAHASPERVLRVMVVSAGERENGGNSRGDDEHLSPEDIERLIAKPGRMRIFNGEKIRVLIVVPAHVVAKRPWLRPEESAEGNDDINALVVNVRLAKEGRRSPSALDGLCAAQQLRRQAHAVATGIVETFDQGGRSRMAGDDSQAAAENREEEQVLVTEKQVLSSTSADTVEEAETLITCMDMYTVGSPASSVAVAVTAGTETLDTEVEDAHAGSITGQHTTGVVDISRAHPTALLPGHRMARERNPLVRRYCLSSGVLVISIVRSLTMLPPSGSLLPSSTPSGDASMEAAAVVRLSVAITPQRHKMERCVLAASIGTHYASTAVNGQHNRTALDASSVQMSSYRSHVDVLRDFVSQNRSMRIVHPLTPISVTLEVLQPLKLSSRSVNVGSITYVHLTMENISSSCRLVIYDVRLQLSSSTISHHSGTSSSDCGGGFLPLNTCFVDLPSLSAFSCRRVDDAASVVSLLPREQYNAVFHVDRSQLEYENNVFRGVGVQSVHDLDFLTPCAVLWAASSARHGRHERDRGGMKHPMQQVHFVRWMLPKRQTLAVSVQAPGNVVPMHHAFSVLLTITNVSTVSHHFEIVVLPKHHHARTFSKQLHADGDGAGRQTTHFAGQVPTSMHRSDALPLLAGSAVPLATIQTSLEKGTPGSSNMEGMALSSFLGQSAAGTVRAGGSDKETVRQEQQTDGMDQATLCSHEAERAFRHRSHDEGTPAEIPGVPLDEDISKSPDGHGDDEDALLYLDSSIRVGHLPPQSSRTVTLRLLALREGIIRSSRVFLRDTKTGTCFALSAPISVQVGIL